MSTLHDTDHNAVSGTTIDATWSIGGSISCGPTDGSGQCAISKGGLDLIQATVTLTVEGTILAGVAYLSASNHDPELDSDGTVIIVAAP